MVNSFKQSDNTACCMSLQLVDTSEQSADPLSGAHGITESNMVAHKLLFVSASFTLDLSYSQRLNDHSRTECLKQVMPNLSHSPSWWRQKGKSRCPKWVVTLDSRISGLSGQTTPQMNTVVWLELQWIAGVISLEETCWVSLGSENDNFLVDSDQADNTFTRIPKKAYLLPSPESSFV